MKELRVLTLDELCCEYRIVIVDWASIVYGLKNPLTFLMNLMLAEREGYVNSHFVFVIDYSRDCHRRVFDSKYRKFFDEQHVEYVLSMDEPAEVKAAKMCQEYRMRGVPSIVLSRDYDPLLYIDDIAMPQRVRYRWLLRHVRVDRRCLENVLSS